jgi:hypothetical protein
MGQREGTSLEATVTDRGGQSVASYGTYAEAQQAVDRLSDGGFPVENVDIVGSDLRLVERVTGRLTRGRAAMAGAGIGATWGLFLGLLIGLFTSGAEWVGLVIGGVLIGTFWGALFGFLAHWATGGRRDFSSMSGLVAARYEVMVTGDQASRAREMLSQSG